MPPVHSSERSRPSLKPRFHRLRQARRKGAAAQDRALDAMQCCIEDMVQQQRLSSGGRFMATTRTGIVRVRP